MDGDWRHNVDPFFREMLPEFERNLLNDTGRLKGLYDQGAREELRRLAHNYKGSAGYFELTELADLARRLETRVNNGEMAEAALDIELWHALVERLEIGRH